MLKLPAKYSLVKAKALKKNCRHRAQIPVIYTVIGSWCFLPHQSKENGTCKTLLLIFHISHNLSSFLSHPFP